MAAANIIRSAVGGLLRKSPTYIVPVVCRLSTVTLQQKYNTIKPYNILNLHNEVPSLRTQRRYSGATPNAGMLEIEDRVLKVCKAYDKLSSVKLTLESHFITDLGLDSLDHVEVIMAMEDEFGFEIPDADAERLVRPKDIIQYVADKEDVYE